MKTINVTSFPFATQWGSVEVPEYLKDPMEIRDYIVEHWDDIKFGEPDLDYCGADFEIEEV